MKIVVNRVGYETGQISLRKAQETIGREIFWQIPNDYRVMVEVRNNGVPLMQQAPKAAITQSINQLAAALSGKADEPAREAGSKSRSWLGIWPARKRDLAGRRSHATRGIDSRSRRGDSSTRMRRNSPCSRVGSQSRLALTTATTVHDPAQSASSRCQRYFAGRRALRVTYLFLRAFSRSLGSIPRLRALGIRS